MSAANDEDIDGAPLEDGLDLAKLRRDAQREAEADDGMK